MKCISIIMGILTCLLIPLLIGKEVSPAASDDVITMKLPLEECHKKIAALKRQRIILWGLLGGSTAGFLVTGMFTVYVMKCFSGPMWR